MKDYISIHYHGKEAKRTKDFVDTTLLQFSFVPNKKRSRSDTDSQVVVYEKIEDRKK